MNQRDCGLHLRLRGGREAVQLSTYSASSQLILMLLVSVAFTLPLGRGNIGKDEDEKELHTGGNKTKQWTLLVAAWSMENE